MDFNRLRQEFKREKRKSFGVFLLMFMAVTLIASSLQMILGLQQSIHTLFTEAQLPQLVQRFQGELNQSAIDELTKNHPEVASEQSLETLNIEGSHIYLGNSTSSQAQNSRGFLFVTQSPQFDFLLGLNNQKLEVEPGCIAVPIGYEKHLRLGDWVRVVGGEFDKSFQVTDFVRDAQMDALSDSPKRFMLNASDYEELKANLGDPEYLVEFQLKDVKQLGEFKQATSEVLKEGSLTDYKAFLWQTALPDGKIAFYLILGGLLGCLMSGIALRQFILKSKDLLKYKFLGGLALILGYVLSLEVTRLLTGHMVLYLGFNKLSFLQLMIAFIGTCVIGGLIIGCCYLTVKKSGQKA